MQRVSLLFLSIILAALLTACAQTPAGSPSNNTPSQTATTTSPIPKTPPQTGAANPAVGSKGTASPAAPATQPAAANAVHVYASGRLSYAQQNHLSFGITGTIAKIFVTETDKVKQGQLLARLDTTSLEQASKTAQLAVNSANITLGSVIVDLGQAQDSYRKVAYPYNYQTIIFDVPQSLAYMDEVERKINSAVTQLKTPDTAAASTSLKQALDNLANSQQLLRRGTGVDVFQNQYLSVDKFWTLRAAQLAADKAQLAVDKAKNDLETAKNNLDIAKTNLDKASILAPADGIIGRVNIKEGDVLSSSSTIVIELIDPSRMELDATVNEIDIPAIQVGQKVAISVDALPGKPVESTVTSINPLPDTTSAPISYTVKIIFPVPTNLPLKSGMAATADITIPK